MRGVGSQPHEKEATLTPESLVGEAETEKASAGRVRARVTLLYFAAARQAAGVGRESVSGETLVEVLGDARLRHGDAFAAVLEGCRIWVNGEPAGPDSFLRDGDEVAVLPPVSGGFE